MNELQVFQYQGREFRATKQDEQPWFIASDVCRALEISDTATALQRLDEDEKGTVSTRTPSAYRQSMNPAYTPWFLAAENQRRRHSNDGLPMKFSPQSGAPAHTVSPRISPKRSGARFRPL